MAHLRKTIAISVGISLLAGCSSTPVTIESLRTQVGHTVTKLLRAPMPTSVESLRSAPRGTVEFEVAQNYKPVFELVLARTRECYLHRPLTKQLVVSDSRDTERRQGNVTVTLVYGPTESEAYLTTDIEALGDGITRVVTYYGKSNEEAEAQVVREWVVNGSETCVR